MTPAVTPTTLDTVLGYAARGWPVIPLYGLRRGVCMCRAGARCKQSPGKHPMTHHGLHDASTDALVIRTWFERYPGCNWGVATGHPLPDGGVLVALDIDPRNGGDETLAALEREHGDLPPTISAISGGAGLHFLFASPEPMGGAKPGDGIDFKASGGYIVVHPSQHVSGRRYEWDVTRHPDETPLAPLPAWVAELARSRSRARPETTGTDAAATLLGEAFRIAGLLGEPLPEGRRMVRCPWSGEHSDDRGRGEDSSTVLLPPTPESSFGGFKCLHSHCQDKGWKDVLKALPGHAVAQARAAFRPKPVPAAPESVPALPASSGVIVAAAQVPDWKAKLLYKRSKTGGSTLERVSANVVTILQNDAQWKGRIRYDRFADVIRVASPPWADLDEERDGDAAEWTDADDVRLQIWLMRHVEYQLDISVQAISQSVDVIARTNSYHEVQEYLASLTWDGVPRIDAFFVRYFGAHDTPYVRAVGSRWLISAVARAFEPGCKADCVPVLEGSQGTYKSSALRALAGAKWFFDSALPIGDKDGYQNLRSKWVCEIPELDSFSRSQVNKVKAYLSQQDEHYRESHGRRARTHRRQNVFAATTNDREWLPDNTGGRRWWPVQVTRGDVAAIRADRDQLWAEAAQRYRDGSPWYLDTPELVALANEEQDDRYQADPWEQPVSRWLERADKRAGVLTYDILVGPLQIEPGRVTKHDEMRLAIVLRALGWERGPQTREDGKRVRKFYPR